RLRVGGRAEIDARIAPLGGDAQPTHVVSPALGVPGALGGVGKSAMGHAHERAAVPLDKIDLDQAGARRHFLVPLPAEAVGEAMNRNDLTELPARGAVGPPGDVLDEIE